MLRFRTSDDFVMQRLFRSLQGNRALKETYGVSISIPDITSCILGQDIEWLKTRGVTVEISMQRFLFILNVVSAMQGDDFAYKDLLRELEKIYQELLDKGVIDE